MIFTTSWKIAAGKKARGLRKVAINCHFEFGSQNQNTQISNVKEPKSEQNSLGNINTAPKVKKSLKAKITLNSEVLERKAIVTLPIKTVSELNCSQHWRKKADRHQMQKDAVSLVLKPIRGKIPLPCHMHLTRYAPGTLDKHDNLPGSLKYIVDACCAILSGDFRPGKADADDRFSFTYGQEKSSQYGVKIEFTF